MFVMIPLTRFVIVGTGVVTISDCYGRRADGDKLKTDEVYR